MSRVRSGSCKMPVGSAHGIPSMRLGYYALCSSRGSAARSPPCDMRTVRQSRRKEPALAASEVCSVSRGTAAAQWRRCNVRHVRDSRSEEPNKSAQEVVQGSSARSCWWWRWWLGRPRCWWLGPPGAGCLRSVLATLRARLAYSAASRRYVADTRRIKEYLRL